ncbi:alpha/beta hydrolase [Gordonia sp. OPL2]|uniref:alpha/beta hydrolase n=1 Tax=Gordonia sp. OPL2 TaxID=2486274 RepID=UPI001655981D|nr:alpha/beta hydrolase [Gordonia sp. OPL2]RPA02541.1 alpha/beta hydrolase [Gordonia sp. OPL2]
MIDRETATLLDALEAGFPRVESMTGPQARKAIRARFRRNPTPVRMHRVDDRTIPGPGGDLPVRIYQPAPDSSTASLPAIVFAHGGGFVFCDLDTHDDLCRAMANGVGAVVISVDYRLAPEHRWPAAANDVAAAIGWVNAHSVELGIDADRVVVAGDSAGGNLAAVAAILIRDRGGPVLSGQALLYPVVAADFTTDSYRRFGRGFYNTESAMRWYWDQYVPSTDDRGHAHASPLHADLTGLPPTLIVTAGHDPLWSEGTQLSRALDAAGVPTIHRDHPGAIHGFMTMPTLTICAEARERTWLDLRGMLSTTRVRRSPTPG